MITLNLVQGTEEWKATRLENFGASEAPAMMGESKYMGRDELLRMKFTGESKPVTSHQQKIFDKGHATEEMARPIAEKIVGEDFYPVTGLLEGSKILASFDGLTMMEDIAFEHKLYNKTLAENVRGGILEPHYYWQLEQQLLVSGAEKVLFVTSDGTEENFEYMWYFSAPERQKALILGWEQFEKDLANYKPSAKKEIIVANEQESFPIIQCQVDGSTVISNLGEFIPKIKAAIDERLSVILETDQDFADTQLFVKNIKSTRASLKQEQVNITNAFESYSLFVNDVATTDGILQKAESSLNKAVKLHKDNKKISIVNKATKAINLHLNELSKSVNGVMINIQAVDFELAMKGKSNFEKMQEAVDSELAKAKIEANELSLIIRKNLDSLSELAKDHKFLFSDHAWLMLKDNDDLINLIKARISEHEQEEAAKKLEEKREIERQAKERADREAAAKLELEAQAIRDEERLKVEDEQRAIREKEKLNKAVEHIAPTPEYNPITSEDVAHEEPASQPKINNRGEFKTPVTKTIHEQMIDRVNHWADEVCVNGSELAMLINILNQYK